MKGNATYVKVIKQAKSKDVSPPVHDFGELRSNVATFCALLFTLFGEGCGLYLSMLQILQILSHPFCMQNKQATPRRCVTGSRGQLLWICGHSLMTLNFRRIFSRMGSTCISQHLRWKGISWLLSTASKSSGTTSHLNGQHRNHSMAPQAPTTRSRVAEVATNPFYPRQVHKYLHPARGHSLRQNHPPSLSTGDRQISTASAPQNCRNDGTSPHKVPGPMLGQQHPHSQQQTV
jgi:hypothetical protein